MTQQLNELTVLGNSGELPSGRAWMEFNGELWVYGKNAMGENEWLVPALSLLDPDDADEMACLGSTLNQEMDHMKQEASEYGREWMEVVLTDGDLDEWRDLSWDEFQQALSNANSPSFTWEGATDTDYTGMEGEFFTIAADAAWDTLCEAIGDED